MARENYSVTLAELLNQRTDIDNLSRVESDRRLVEDDYLGRTEHRLRDTYALLVAL